LIEPHLQPDDDVLRNHYEQITNGVDMAIDDPLWLSARRVVVSLH
jgi:hypothetical protein